MSRRGPLAPFALVVLVLLAALVAGCPKPAARPTEPPPTPVGTWREYWGVPGETDVEYHDKYQVGVRDGEAFVLPVDQEEPDEIRSVRIDGDRLELVIHTSFDVRYDLRLDEIGNTMTGTATTPEKTVPIRWERISR